MRKLIVVLFAMAHVMISVAEEECGTCGDAVRQVFELDMGEGSSSVVELKVGEKVDIMVYGLHADGVYFGVESVSGLPKGLKFVNENSCMDGGDICTAGIDMIEGMPTKAGNYLVSFGLVKNNYGPVVKTVKRTFIVNGGGGSGGGDEPCEGGVPEEWTKARTLTGVYEDSEAGPAGMIEVKCGKASKKGVAKVSAKVTLFTGKTISFKSVSVDVGVSGCEEESETVVSWPATKKSPALDLLIGGDYIEGEWLADGEENSGSVYSAEIGGLEDGYFSLDVGGLGVVGEYAESLCKEGETSWTDAYLLDDCCNCVNIRFANNKFTVPKAGSVKLKKYKEDGETWYEPEYKGWENLIGLKLSYKSKTGMLSGSYSAYIRVDKWTIKRVRVDGDYEEVETCTSTLKKLSVKLSGCVINGEAVLVATVNKFGSEGLALERQDGKIELDGY